MISPLDEMFLKNDFFKNDVFIYCFWFRGGAEKGLLT